MKKSNVLPFPKIASIRHSDPSVGFRTRNRPIELHCGLAVAQVLNLEDAMKKKKENNEIPNYKKFPVTQNQFREFRLEIKSEIRALGKSIDARFVKQDGKLEARFREQEARLEARFLEQDAKLDARFLEQDARLEARFREQDAKLEARFLEQDARLEARFREQDAKLDARFLEQDARLEARFREQDAKLDARFLEQDARLEARFREQDAKLDARFLEQDAKFEKMFSMLHELKAEMIRQNEYIRAAFDAIASLSSAVERIKADVALHEQILLPQKPT